MVATRLGASRQVAVAAQGGSYSFLHNTQTNIPRISYCDRG